MINLVFSAALTLMSPDLAPSIDAGALLTCSSVSVGRAESPQATLTIQNLPNMRLDAHVDLIRGGQTLLFGALRSLVDETPTYTKYEYEMWRSGGEAKMTVETWTGVIQRDCSRFRYSCEDIPYKWTRARLNESGYISDFYCNTVPSAQEE